MTAAEAAPASLGPRYAPDDPTLPQPWKGLIDGSTGVLYYWNPETNVTQYEKPTALAPPLPPGPPPAASTPSLAPVQGARTTQAADVQNHQMQNQQQMNPLLLQQSQTTTQVVQQHNSQMPLAGHQQVGPSLQQGQLTAQHLRPQMMQQYLGQQPSSQLGQVHIQAGSQVLQQPTQQMGQKTQIYQGSSGGNPQGYPFPHQQTQYIPYQQNVIPQGHHQSSQHQSHQVLQGQQFPHQQDNKTGFPLREDTDTQLGKQVGHSPVHVQHSASSVQFQQGGLDSLQPQNGPRHQNQMGPLRMHGQQPNAPPFGPKMSFDESPLGRGGSDYYYNPNKDGQGVVPLQPKLAAIPVARNNQVNA